MDVTNPLFRKAWSVSRVEGDKDPFRILGGCSIAQIDAGLEMSSIDGPRRYTFSRGDDKAMQSIDAHVGWMDVLKGEALEEFRERLIPKGLQEAVANSLAAAKTRAEAIEKAKT